MARRKNGAMDLTVLYLGNFGFHASLIARLTGLSVPQVYGACKFLGIRLRAYRDGETEPAERIIRAMPKARMRRAMNRVMAKVLA